MRKIKFALIVLLCAILAGVLFACDKKNGRNEEAERRAAAVTRLENAILGLADYRWSVSLQDDAIAALNNCGDFVANSAWIELIGDTVGKSSIQTGKIEVMADVITSDEFKQFGGDPKLHADKVFILANRMGLTPSDVAGLGYDLLVRTVTDSDGVYERIISKSTQLSERTDINMDARDNLNSALYSAQAEYESYKSGTEARNEIAAALSDVESDLQNLVKFAYQTALLVGNDELEKMISSASDGVLSDVSDSEILTYFHGVEEGIKQFRDSLTADTLEKLTAAIGAVLDSAAGLSYPDDFLGPVFDWLRYTYASLDLLPSVCDLALNAADILKRADDSGTYAFIRDLKKLLGTPKLPEYNEYVIYAQILEAALSKTDKNRALVLFDEVTSGSDSNYQRYIALFYLCVFANKTGDNPRFMDLADYSRVFNLTIADAYLRSFRTSYSQYISDGTGENEMRNFAAGLISFAQLELRTDAPATSQWYSGVLNGAETKIAAEASALRTVVIQDLRQYLEYFFDQQLEIVSQIADFGLVEDAASPRYAELHALLQRIYPSI